MNLEEFLLFEAEEEEKRLLDGLGVLAIDNSQVRCFLECQRKYQFRHVWGLSSGMEPWLVTGKAWGAAMDVVWKDEEREGRGEDVHSRAVAAFEEVFAREAAKLSPEGEEDWRIVSRHYYHEALADYLSSYQTFIASTFDGERTICELPFEVEIESESGSFHLTGRLDKVVWNIEEENWWVVEHKTTGMYLSQQYLSKWTNDNQIKTYGWVGKRVWGERFGGILVDCVSIGRKGRVAMEMLPIILPPLSRGDWLKDLVEIAREMRGKRKGGRFVKNTDACEKFNRLCSFFEACSAQIDPRGSLESFGLVEDRWDPRAEAGIDGGAEVLRIAAGEEASCF